MTRMTRMKRIGSFISFTVVLAEVHVTQRLFSTNPFFVLAAPLQYSDSYRNNRILRMHTQEMMQQNVKQEGAGGKRVGSLDSWQRSQ